MGFSQFGAELERIINRNNGCFLGRLIPVSVGRGTAIHALAQLVATVGLRFFLLHDVGLLPECERRQRLPCIWALA